MITQGKSLEAGIPRWILDRPEIKAIKGCGAVVTYVNITAYSNSFVAIDVTYIPSKQQDANEPRP